MSTNYTENFDLCQWEPTDPVLRTDFNADNAKIDAALGLVKGCNCHLYVKTYTGIGGNGPVVHTFPYRPMAVMIFGSTGGTWVFSVRGAATISGHSAVNTYLATAITWDTRSVSIGTAEDTQFYCFNSPGGVYNLLALLDVQDE